MQKNNCHIVLCLALAGMLAASTVKAQDTTKATTQPATVTDSTRSDTLHKSLATVVVTGNKPIIRREVDRIVYDLQADAESKTNSVLDMMRKVPYLSLDADKNLLFKGNSSFKILINGRPSGLVERNPREILQSMPASTIERIEVITTPPSKYDAEGLAGIINIITVKKKINGYTGTFNMSEKIPAGGPGAGFSFSIKDRKVGVNTFGGGSYYHSPAVDYSNSRFTYDDPSSLMQRGSRSSNGKNGYWGSEISVELDSLQLLFATFNISGNRSTGSFNQHTVLTDLSAEQQYDQTNNNKNDGSGWDGSLNYQLGSNKNKTRFFTLSYRYAAYRNSSYNQVDLFNKISFELPSYRQENRGASSEHTAQADFIQTVKGVTMEAGVKAIFRLNESNFQSLSYNSSSGNFEPDAANTNRFNNHQNVFSAYNAWQYSRKKWDYKAGLRIEQTVTDADFKSTSTAIKQDYLNVIPSLMLNRKFNDNSSLTLGFSQRIKRPGINRLNPYIDRSNPNFEISGNPNLKAGVLNMFQLGYGISKKVSVNVSTDYSFVNNLDLRISVYDSLSKITRTTYQNAGKAWRWGFDYNINFPITKNWRWTLNGNLAYFHVTGQTGTENTTLKIFTHRIAGSTMVQLKRGWQFTGNLNIIGKMPNDLQVTANSMVTYGVGVSKNLLKDHLSLSASTNNPFKQYRNNIATTIGPAFEQVAISREYFAQYSVSVNYRFGKMKGDISKARRGISNNDVSN